MNGITYIPILKQISKQKTAIIDDDKNIISINGEYLNSMFSKKRAATELISCAIDLGQWKYSWHNNVKNIFEDEEMQVKIKSIIEAMKQKRNEEIYVLDVALAQIEKFKN